jgi:hypothetical protein
MRARAQYECEDKAAVGRRNIQSAMTSCDSGALARSARKVSNKTAAPQTRIEA